MKQPSTIYLVSLLILLACSNLLANEETFEIDIRVYGLRPGSYENIWLIDYKGEQAINFKPKSRSQTYTATLLNSDPVLRFIRRESTISGNSDTPLSATKIPTASRELLIIFNQELTSDSTLPYKTIALEDSMQSFSLGSLRVLNMTGVDIFGTFNGSRFILKNGQSNQAGRTSQDGATEIAIAAEGKTRIHLLYKNSLNLLPDSRGLLILRPPARKGSLRIGGHLLTETITDD